MQINIQGGGTNAGWRKTRSARDWVCPNDGSKLRYYWTKCPNCGAPRPE